ncbi:hypothetical protein FRB95_007344 [Tulasnella sp. JGI-2019a]|nr:hypothetical protein FRB95_007344 [Tulasnella sp. JGI-2019a]
MADKYLRPKRDLVKVTVPLSPTNRAYTMESALSVPEILDEILRVATPSAQAAVAQTCQYWSDCSLRWLWRRMDSFYSLLKLLSPLECVNKTWEFTSDLSASDWDRFNRYAARIFSLKISSRRPYQGQHDSVVSPQIFEEINLRCPTPDSIFPNLTEIKWWADATTDLSPILLFLVPTVQSLKLTCGGAVGMECLKVLGVLGPRKIHLTDFGLKMRTHDQDFLDCLPAILADQTQLTKVRLPPYSATRAIVAVLGQLPSLKHYAMNIFPEFLIPRELGMEFDWHDGTFPGLDKLAVCITLANTSSLMAKSCQPRLRHFELVNRKPFSYTELATFCSILSVSQPCLTLIDLDLYSDTAIGSMGSLSFESFRPLLQCTALVKLCVGSPLAMTYGDEDITTMASSWPDLQDLRLCSSPAIDIRLSVGQPLRSVGTFTRSFNRLTHLNIYINSLDVGLTSDAQSDVHHHRLTEISFGTSPGPPGSTEAASRYLADLIEIGGVIKGRRSLDHILFLDSNPGNTKERSRRAAFWYAISANAKIIHAGANHLT